MLNGILNGMLNVMLNVMLDMLNIMLNMLFNISVLFFYASINSIFALFNNRSVYYTPYMFK